MSPGHSFSSSDAKYHKLEYEFHEVSRTSLTETNAMVADPSCQMLGPDGDPPGWLTQCLINPLTYQCRQPRQITACVRL